MAEVPIQLESDMKVSWASVFPCRFQRVLTPNQPLIVDILKDLVPMMTLPS